jgi:hypothetical protein
MEHMHLRSSLVLVSALFCAPATLTASASCNLNYTGGGNSSTQNPSSGPGTYICPDAGTYTDITSQPMANPGETTTAWQLQTYTLFVTQSVVQNGTENTAEGFDPPLPDLASVTLAQIPAPLTWVLAILGAGIVCTATMLRRRGGKNSAAFKRVKQG